MGRRDTHAREETGRAHGAAYLPPVFSGGAWRCPHSSHSLGQLVLGTLPHPGRAAGPLPPGHPGRWGRPTTQPLPLPHKVEMRPEPLSDQTLTTRQRCWACPRPPQLPDEAPAPGRCLRVLGNWPAMRDPRSRSLARLRLSRAAPHGGHPGLPCGGAPSALHTTGSAQPYVLPSRSVKPSGEVTPPPSSGTAGWGAGHVHGGR